MIDRTPGSARRGRIAAFAILAIALLLAWRMGGSRATSHAGVAVAPAQSDASQSRRANAASSKERSDATPSPAFSAARPDQRRASQAELAARAAAASNAYLALKLCVDAENARAELADPDHMADLDRISRDEGPQSADPAWRLRVLDTVARTMEVVSRAKIECTDARAQATDGSIYALAHRAAVLGDRDAAACYVAMAWPMNEAHWNDRALRQAYRSSAPALLDAGIAAGEWRMVAMAQTAADGSWMAPMPPGTQAWRFPAMRWLPALRPDPVRALALVRLQEAGSADPVWAARHRRLGDHLAKRLTPAQVRAASTWAERMFRTAFHGQRSLRNGPEDPFVCE